MTTKPTEGFVTVNGIPTHVMTWGSWIEDKLSENQKEIVLLITGNPGLPGYYTTFLTQLHSQLCLPIWAVSLAGHILPPCGEQRLPSLQQNPHLYSLEGQIEHKLQFIKTYVPENVKILLIGHSIGSKIILGVLKDDKIRSKVKKAYLLFPTIERMAETRNGKVMTNVVRRIVPIILFLTWIFTFLPQVIQTFLLSAHFVLRRMPTYHVATTMKLMNPTVLANVFFLALEEMEKVKELDDEAITECGDILFLYYGTTDGWVPVNYWQEMVQKHPEVKCMLCKRKLDHAFVLRYSNEMAHILLELIKEDT